MSYVKDLMRAVEYIESHLREPLSLEGMARQGGYSPYHFHRLFHACTGETPATYVRRRRLSEAARDLEQGRGRVLDIALRYQLGSQESFTRAFKPRSASPPGNIAPTGSQPRSGRAIG